LEVLDIVGKNTTGTMCWQTWHGWACWGVQELQILEPILFERVVWQSLGFWWAGWLTVCYSCRPGAMRAMHAASLLRAHGYIYYFYRTSPSVLAFSTPRSSLEHERECVWAFMQTRQSVDSLLTLYGLDSECDPKQCADPKSGE
jgi:hypothetical protein